MVACMSSEFVRYRVFHCSLVSAFARSPSSITKVAQKRYSGWLRRERTNVDRHKNSRIPIPTETQSQFIYPAIPNREVPCIPTWRRRGLNGLSISRATCSAVDIRSAPGMMYWSPSALGIVWRGRATRSAPRITYCKPAAVFSMGLFDGVMLVVPLS
jgi:hypothetical protein